MCESCKELKELGCKVEVDMIYSIEAGYLHPISEMIINYCPVCGKKIEVDQ